LCLFLSISFLYFCPAFAIFYAFYKRYHQFQCVVGLRQRAGDTVFNLVPFNIFCSLLEQRCLDLILSLVLKLELPHSNDDK
jgi:hypothetical protein